MWQAYLELNAADGLVGADVHVSSTGRQVPGALRRDVCCAACQQGSINGPRKQRAGVRTGELAGLARGRDVDLVVLGSLLRRPATPLVSNTALNPAWRQRGGCCFHALGTPRAGDNVVHGGTLGREVQRQRRELRGRASLHKEHLRATGNAGTSGTEREAAARATTAAATPQRRSSRA